ncbi:MAG: hypothetical protein HOL66_10485 [Rhodospirillaceae bacterium]|nr:hypothetical protein [Rhodospirillaceae bacterium]
MNNSDKKRISFYEDQVGVWEASMLQRTRLGLTFDIDWVPDWCIKLCVDLVRNANYRATIFITHESDILADLRKLDSIELGIHPNLLPGSTHGDGVEDVLNYCLSLVPEARVMRTHALVQSSRLFKTICDEYPQIETDFSLFLPFHYNLAPTICYFGNNGNFLTRIPYNWSDDQILWRPVWDWTAAPSVDSGFNVFAFHPIHVALNSANLDNHTSIMQLLDGRPLLSLRREEVEPFVNHGAGVRTFLESLLTDCDATQSETASQLSRAFNGNVK